MTTKNVITCLVWCFRFRPVANVTAIYTVFLLYFLAPCASLSLAAVFLFYFLNALDPQESFQLKPLVLFQRLSVYHLAEYFKRPCREHRSLDRLLTPFHNVYLRLLIKGRRWRPAFAQYKMNSFWQRPPPMLSNSSVGCIHCRQILITLHCSV